MICTNRGFARKFAAAAVLVLSACGTPAQTLQSAQRYCAARPNGHLEVYVPRAIVRRVLGERLSRSGEHEGFVMSASGATFKVEDNVAITGPIPLQRGEPISLLGQYECDDGVIHWTHHDPGGRHPRGYIDAGGQRYE